MGDCIYDSMTITTPGSPAPPVICGYNTGQHMWVEASEACNRIVFSLGLGRQTTSPRYCQALVSIISIPNLTLTLLTTPRSWMIRVTQFDSTQESSFVPPIGK